MSTYIITGANGFIGSHLCNTLTQRGATVYAVIRGAQSNCSKLIEHENLKVVICESEQIESLSTKIDLLEVKCFIHTAWDGNSGEKRQDFVTQNTNAVNTVRAYDFCEKAGIPKFLALGTISEKVAENIDRMAGVSAQNIFYGYAKGAARLACEIKSRKYTTKFVWARLANVYGEGNDTGNIISYTLDKLTHNQVAEFSKGEQMYDLIYVADCVERILALATQENQNSLYYVGSGTPRLLRDYLLAIGEILDKKDLIKLGQRGEDNIIFDQAWFDASPIQNEYQFASVDNLKVGILNTVASKQK